MRLVKIALGSVNPTVGSVRSNTDRCIRMAREMAAADATVGAFPVCLQDSSPGARADTHCLLLCGPCRLGDDGMGCSDLAHAACPTGARCMTGTVKSVRQGICVYD